MAEQLQLPAASCLCCQHPIWVQVQHLAAPLAIHLPANAPGKAEAGPSAWTLASTWETKMKLWAPAQSSLAIGGQF